MNIGPRQDDYLLSDRIQRQMTGSTQVQSAQSLRYLEEFMFLSNR
jgi:hypothetical protein